MLDDVALMLGSRPAGDNGDNIAGSERGVGVVDEVVLGVGKPLRKMVSKTPLRRTEAMNSRQESSPC